MILDFINQPRKLINIGVFVLQDLFRSIFLLSIITVSGTFFIAHAQSSDDVIRVETELVAFEVAVTDKDGKPVRGLDVKNFKLFEDDVERPIDFFEPIRKQNENRPLSIVFALDVSGSMTAGELTQLQAALQQFVKKLADYNSYSAVCL